MPLHRYTPFMRKGDRVVTIMDWDAMDVCRLPAKNGELKLLTFGSTASARAWLQTCYMTWALWERRQGPGTPPERWRPRNGPSPYDCGLPLGPMPPGDRGRRP